MCECVTCEWLSLYFSFGLLFVVSWILFYFITIDSLVLPLILSTDLIHKWMAWNNGFYDGWMWMGFECSGIDCIFFSSFLSIKHPFVWAFYHRKNVINTKQNKWMKELIWFDFINVKKKNKTKNRMEWNCFFFFEKIIGKWN